ncbi:MAG: DMT family transporter [Bdellovibrionales bacterium]|nr:DMT family transporter [Bdellovibrionales bacterium]
MEKRRAIRDLIIATLLWGFGFVATVWALRAYSPVEILIYRFGLAAIFGVLILFVLTKGRVPWSGSEMRLAAPAGFLLAVMQLTQAQGLLTTTATKSGFITSLYVVLIPLIEILFLKKRSSLQIYFFSFLALAGTFLLAGGHYEALAIGDLWTFACAVLAAIHIIYIGKVAPGIADAFRFNVLQSIVAAVALLPFLLTQPKIALPTSDLLPNLGILSLIFGSSLLAFFLQVRAQRHLPNSMASMVSLLESPFAAGFGILLLAETLGSVQISGAVLILLSSASSIVFDKT